MSASVAPEWKPAPQPEAEDDLLQASFALAYFIHRDRRIAAEIALGAMRKLEVAATAQLRRLYYRGRGEPPSPFKASWADRHLLQRLVYFESESWERFAEERDPGSLTEEDLLLRFVKHLSQITMKRSSFYASIAVGRIVHAYSTADTMAIYDAVAPEGCERKQSDYFRARKAQLLEEVRERFGDLLSIVRGPHREERIESVPLTPERAAWMRECLRVTTPWGTPCSEPGENAGEAGKRDVFDSREVRRFHALFHPPCFTLLARSLRLADPRARLAIPRFRLAARSPRPRPPGPNDRSARLLPDERRSIRRDLQEDSRRRRNCRTGLLRVLVDGRERARWDPVIAHRTRFPVDDGAELVEVRARTAEGELLLAAHPLTDDGSDVRPRAPQAFSIVLESGQTIGFRIEREEDLRTVELTYRESAPLRAALFAARRLAGYGERAVRIAAATLPPPIGALVILGALALGLYFGRGSVERNPGRAAAIAPSSVSVAHDSKSEAVVAAPEKRASSESSNRKAIQKADASPLLPSPGLAHAPRRSGAARLEPSLPPRTSLAFMTESDRSPEMLSFGAQWAPSTFSGRISLDSQTSLQAVRESFLQSLSADPVSSAAASGRTLVSSNGVHGEIQRRTAQQDPRAAALSTALAKSPNAGESLERPQPLLLDWKLPEDRSRVRILRRVVAPGPSEGAHCRPQELACPVARISAAKVLEGSRREAKDREGAR